MQRAPLPLPPNPFLPLSARPPLMLQSLKERARLRRKAGEIYGAIVTQARQPAFYAKLGIPDTPVGRYEAVVVHLFLVLERLRAEGARAGILPRALIEAFVADMDDCLRELGTGDIAVGKKVRRAAAGFYERSGDYRAALAEPDPERLGHALARHLLGHEGDTSGALARYVQVAAALLADQSCEDLLAGRIAFPLPDAIAGDAR
jgi:cytochrome b pre-mRNA-processing protein 3